MPDTNLINNPLFQPPYYEDGFPEGKVAQGWRVGYNASRKRPEWRQAAADWELAQQWFCTSDMMDAWIRQRVSVGAANKGKNARLVVVCALESKNTGSGIGDYFVSIGIDRVGDESVGVKTTQWLTPQHQSGVPKWTTLEITAPIENDVVTVFIQAENQWRVSGSIFVKSAHLYVVDATTPPVTPPPVTPPPVAGECQSATIIQAVNSARDAVLAKLASLTLKAT